MYTAHTAPTSLYTPAAWHRCVAWCAAAAAVAHLAACTSMPQTDIAAVSGEPTVQAAPFHTWKHTPLPGKTATDFSFVQLDGREVAVASANASASMLRQPLRVEAAQLGKLRFSWMVPQLIAQADMALRQADDYAMHCGPAGPDERAMGKGDLHPRPEQQRP